MVALTVTLAVATRPREGETANGDQWIAQQRDGRTRIAVIDGLGHGIDAEEVARLAVEALAAEPELGAAEALVACDRALQGTRGAAAAVMVVDTTVGRLDFAGVGNVAGRLVLPDGEHRLSADRGIVGTSGRTPHVLSLECPRGALVLLHSDGVSQRLESPPLAPGQPLQELADRLLATWGRPTDDATLVLAAFE